MSTLCDAFLIGAMTGEDTGPPEDDESHDSGRRGCFVYTAGSLYEAQLVLDLLEEAAIGAKLFNAHLIGALGELPLNQSLPKIWLLDESTRHAARSVIDAYEARRKQPLAEERRCNACGELSPGNFELCWSCREPFESD